MRGVAQLGRALGSGPRGSQVQILSPRYWFSLREALNTVALEIKLLQHGDEAVLANVAAGVFDCDLNEQLTEEFLGDARHHLVVAIENSLVVGFASAVHYIHPDKRPELWINEVGVAPTHQARGIGKALLRALFDAGRATGCGEAWVLTDRQNASAMRLYTSLGGSEAPGDQVMLTFSLTPDGSGVHHRVAAAR